QPGAVSRDLFHGTGSRGVAEGGPAWTTTKSRQCRSAPPKCAPPTSARRRPSIWYGAVARADAEAIEIGEGSNIQDGCTLHSDAGFPLVVGRHVTVGHRVVL